MASFLGVRIELDPTTGLMELKQSMIDTVTETLGLGSSITSGKFAPA